jgi:hypothetical protein
MSSHDHVPPFFVVSLVRAEDRRRRMVARLTRQDLPFTLVDAVDAVTDVSEVDRYTKNPGAGNQERGVAACLASHLRALRAGLASGEPEFLVIEDDVLLARDFRRRFLVLRENIPSDVPLTALAYLVWNWDGFSWAGVHASRETLTTMGPDLWGTQMYLITRSWADRCLTVLDRPLSEIATGDVRTSELIVRGARDVGGLVARPPLGIEELSGSLLVPEAGNSNHAGGQLWWNMADFDDLDNTKPRASGLLLALPILSKMGPVEGWLDAEEADLLIASTNAAAHRVATDEFLVIVEVGSYCGRSTVVLASAAQALRSRARVYAIDPHEGTVGAADRALLQEAPTLERFVQNIRAAGVEDLVEVIQKCSHEVTWDADRLIGLLFIDGLHDYANVSRDFNHFEPYLRVGSLVAFHDYAAYYPGVVSFVDELIASGRYRRLELVKSMIVVEVLAIR